VDARRLTLRQVTALANANLKSSLDVSFADVNLSEAELALFRAENDIRSALTELNAAMGLSQEQSYEVSDAEMPGPLAEKAEPLIGEALQQRPDLAGLRLTHQASLAFAAGERRLQYPTLSVIAAAGVIPQRDERLRGHYDAAALNLNLPILNGGLFSARKAEAAAKARAAEQEVRGLELRIARDVKLAWLNAENAFRRLDVTARLFEQASRSMRLAQSRYDLGLSSIIELTQAQLNQTSAEIANANARYEYQAARSALDYETGALK
jgi:outer membrane protein